MANEPTLMFCGKCGTPMQLPSDADHARYCDALRVTNLKTLTDPEERACLVDHIGDTQVMVMMAILGNGRQFCKGCQCNRDHPHAGIFAKYCEHGELFPHWV